MSKKVRSVRLDLKLRQEVSTIYSGSVQPYEDARFAYSVRKRQESDLWDWDVSYDDCGYGGPALRADCISGYAATKTLALTGIAQAIGYILNRRVS